MKKFLTICAVLIMTVAICCVSACCVKYSETFRGIISEESYSETEEAATAFLENEICGSTTNAEFVKYVKTSEMSKEEIQSLNIPEETKSLIDYAEKGEVLYNNLPQNSVTTMSSQKTAEYSQLVYILKIGNVYKYYVPAQSTGEIITKSYFDSVFDAENYRNCTIKVKMVFDMKGTLGDSGSWGSSMNIEQTLKLTETAIEVFYKASESFLSMTQEINEKYYIIEDNGVIRAFDENNKECLPSDVGFEYSSLNEYFKTSMPDFIDHTYFVKTDSGFELREDRLVEFLKNELESYVSDPLELDKGFWEAKENYFISEGKIQKTTFMCSIVDDDGYIKSSGEQIYSDYGKTSVNIPKEIQNLL